MQNIDEVVNAVLFDSVSFGDSKKYDGGVVDAYAE